MNMRAQPSPRDNARVHALATELFDALRAATSDGVGISRPAYSELESTALDIIDAKARAVGLRTERDAAANLVVTLDGSEYPGLERRIVAGAPPKFSIEPRVGLWSPDQSHLRRRH